jgi:hypothetical protein
VTQNLVGEGEVLLMVMPGKKGFWSAVSACIILRRTYGTAFPARSVTKMSLSKTHPTSWSDLLHWAVQLLTVLVSAKYWWHQQDILSDIRYLFFIIQGNAVLQKMSTGLHCVRTLLYNPYSRSITESTKNKHESLLGYNAVQSRSRLMFQRCILPPSSGR